MVAQLHPGLLRQSTGDDIGAHIESNYDGARGECQIDVRFRNSTHTATNDLDRHLAGRELGQRVPQRLDRALDIGLDQDVEKGRLLLVHLRENVLEFGRFATGQLDVSEFALPEQRYLAGLSLVLQCDDVIARVGRT